VEGCVIKVHGTLTPFRIINQGGLAAGDQLAHYFPHSYFIRLGITFDLILKARVHSNLKDLM